MIIQQVCFDNWPSRTQWDVHLEVMTPHWRERSVAHDIFWHYILYHFNIIYIIKGNGFQTLHSRKSKLNNFITDETFFYKPCLEPIIYFYYIYSYIQINGSYRIFSMNKWYKYIISISSNTVEETKIFFSKVIGKC